MTRVLLLLVAASLLAPASAAAHATLVRTIPKDGAVLAQAPHTVRIVFDDGGVRVNARTVAVSNRNRASILAGPARTVDGGRVVSIPLRSLADGDYSVRWSVTTDDGHREEGTVVFGVGLGRAPATSVLGARQQLTWQNALSRALYFLGVMLAAGVTLFTAIARGTLAEARLRKPQMHLLFAAFLLAFLGGSAIVHDAPGGTRYAYVVQAAVTVALAGGAAAALAPAYPRARYLAWGAGLALLPAPTLAGHALDPDQPRVLAALVDVAHLGASAIWLGGLAAFVWSVPRATDDDAVRSAVARRFSRVAFFAVLVLAGTGLVRALTELRAVDQIWSTGYGRTLVVKTAIFLPLLGLGWLNRTVLLAAFARLRRSMRVEIVLLAGVVVAVGVLTDLRPGKAAPRAPELAASPTPGVPVLAQAGGVVAAQELGRLAVGVSVRAGTTTVTVLDGSNRGPRGLDVRVNGERTRACGAGCYRVGDAAERLVVSVDGARAVFRLPAAAPKADALLARATRAYRSAKTLVLDERLASSPSNAQVTRFRLSAPHNLAYAVRGGPQAIVIGGRRWDRTSPGGRWTLSPQSPIDVTQTYWRRPRDVRLVAPHTLTFFDPTLPAWFRLELDARTGMPKRTHMIAAAHFMTDSYSRFGRPVAISPPPSR